MKEMPSANSNISHYRIVSRIGAGGMGEVFRAYDSRLDREVAIKVLPPDLANHEDRLLRFEQEAKATSALNHPNILTVYDIGEHEGSPFIVAELLDGEELRGRLDGPIPLRKTIDYAQQIVSGLSAAHERGVAHRDLKPENLFITKDDRVKILDFGLAKLLEREKGSDGSEDATKKALTDPGVVMGTVGYMSPEQVRGLPADHRSDIFSFGVILYEMLTGRQAFRGESVVETMHSVLKDDVPELDGTNAKVPPAVDKLMRRCLEKRPEHRFHSAHDLGFALDALASPTSASGSGLTTAVRSIDEGSARSRSNGPGRAVWAAAGLFLVSTVILGALYFRRVDPPRATVRFTIAPPEKSAFSGLALSPDGRQVAFATVGTAGATSLWVRSVDSLDSQQLAGTEGAAFPFWSPDSRTIGFFAGNKLRKIDAGGGPSQTLADGTADPRGGTWTLDGTIIFSPATTSPLMRVSASGGPATELTKLDTELGQTSHRWPSMLPDGRHFLYFARGTQPEKQGIYVGSVDSSETKLLIAAPVTGAYTEADGTGYLLFVRESTLVAQRFDTTSFTLSGDAVPLAQGIFTVPGEVGPTAFSAFSVSSGNLLYFNGSVPTTRFTWFDRTGKPLGAVTEPGQHGEPSLSSADTKLLFGGSDGTAPGDIYLQDLSRGSTTRLTFDPAQESSALFSPDESQIVFTSNRSGATGIYRKPANGAGNDQLLLPETDLAFPDSWSRDGRYLLFEKNGGAKTRFDLWALPMTGDPTPFPYLETAFQETHSQFSPDGRWVAYASDESGRPEIYIQSFPIGNGKWQVSTAGGDQPQWSADGKELFYMAADRNLMAVSIKGGAALEIGRPEVLFQTNTPLTGITDDRNNYVPARDGRRFMVNTLDETANAQPLTFVLNWAADLKK